MQPIVAITKVEQILSAILLQIFSRELYPGERLVE